jgi:hypothetical protein
MIIKGFTCCNVCKKPIVFFEWSYMRVVKKEENRVVFDRVDHAHSYRGKNAIVCKMCSIRIHSAIAFKIQFRV